MHSPRSKYGLSSDVLNLIASDCCVLHDLNRSQTVGWLRSFGKLKS